MRQNTDRRGRECNNVIAYTYGAERVFYALSSASTCRQKSIIGASLSAEWTNEAVSILRFYIKMEVVVCSDENWGGWADAETGRSMKNLKQNMKLLGSTFRSSWLDNELSRVERFQKANIQPYRSGSLVQYGRNGCFQNRCWCIIGCSHYVWDTSHSPFSLVRLNFISANTYFDKTFWLTEYCSYSWATQ